MKRTAAGVLRRAAEIIDQGGLGENRYCGEYQDAVGAIFQAQATLLADEGYAAYLWWRQYSDWTEVGRSPAERAAGLRAAADYVDRRIADEEARERC